MGLLRRTYGRSAIGWTNSNPYDGIDCDFSKNWMINIVFSMTGNIKAASNLLAGIVSPPQRGIFDMAPRPRFLIWEPMKAIAYAICHRV